MTHFPPGLVLTPKSRWPLNLPESTVSQVLARSIPSFDEKRPENNRVAGKQLISIVVISFNNLVFNRLCLESVLASTATSNIELIVVDNGSSDGTVQYLLELARLNAVVKILLNRENLGFAKACNQGLSSARGDLLVVLNNDTVVAGNWLERLTNRLDDPTVGMVGPVTNRCGNEAQIETSCGTLKELSDFAAARALSHDSRNREVPMLVMFCVALRKEVFECTGNLDERFEIGLFEDEDYCVRLRKLGYRLICAEDVFIHHFGQASIGKLAKSDEYGKLFHTNRKKFENKWGVNWTPHRQRPKRGYQKLVQKIQHIIESILPHDTTVLVVSKGDEDLLTLAGHRALHFPSSPDGLYAGYYPENSLAAIEHLEYLKGEGGQFLLIPAPMFWWLEYYPEFAEYLARKYQATRYEDSCIIYQLGGPALSRKAPNGSNCKLVERADRLNWRLVTVIFPVFGSLGDVKGPLRALLCFGQHPHRLLLIDNCNHDREVSKLLREVVEQHDHVVLAVSDRHRSAVTLANIGFRLAPGDAVLVDSSAKVSTDWLEKLSAEAGSRKMVSTVSTFPAGSEGRCIFVSRTALRSVGLFDDESYSHFQDALSDFHLRARDKGFADFAGNVNTLPRQVGSGRNCLLMVIHSGSGGARFALEDLLPNVSRKYRCLLLITGLSSWRLYEVAGKKRELVREYRFSEDWRLDTGLGSERKKVLSDLCQQFGIDLVHVHHLLCSGPGLINELKKSSIPIIVSFHDYYTLCPTAHLIDNEGSFCGGKCSPGFGECTVDKQFIRNPIHRLKHEFVLQHRQSMEQALAQCDCFTVPSISTKNRLVENFDSISVSDLHVVEHGCDVVGKNVAIPPTRGALAKIICMGSLNEAKGLKLIEELMQLDAKNERRFEFHFLGKHPGSFQPENLGGVCHGPYERGQYLEFLAAIGPSFSLLASICEETFSFTLSESWAAGLPVFASDRGALRDRINKHGGGWLFDPDNAVAFYSGMVAVLESSDSWKSQVEAVARIEGVTRSSQAVSMMRIFSQCLNLRNLQGRSLN